MRGVHVQQAPYGSDRDHDGWRITVHPERTVVRVEPAGELDIATAPLLEAQLLELRDSGFDCVVLDLRRLTFMDSTGVALILAEDRCARHNGHDFTLIAGPRAIQRVLEICGVAGVLRFKSSAADARRASAPSSPAEPEPVGPALGS
jgi:anti-sigma B factor antagonist